ncbi:NAD(P)H-hydrate dehydratase [Luteibaculum oceani]|uniref:Bifunctional NAD(P)H-hydrate repair enzyme n=1 Tax=Luteibaculum oceani TaxID=1294296 RepID=A0A5C6VA91_9FLAO|nr:NAD(P)H-hydrate dehydratase [Luteibaculum oceani]TXC82169.1 NAD(P)H-hydrate dehydratase [Luteibaculum oceani]
MDACMKPSPYELFPPEVPIVFEKVEMILVPVILSSAVKIRRNCYFSNMILDAHNIKNWDSHSIKSKWQSSLYLMENAALSLSQIIHENYRNKNLVILCGSGNNGGDGYALARMLFKVGCRVDVISVLDPKRGSNECNSNYQKLLEIGAPISQRNEWSPAKLNPKTIIVDCIFGTGLNRPLEGELLAFIQEINDLPNYKIAVDLPSGMLADEYRQPGVVFKADKTFTLQCFKRCFLNRENLLYTGEISMVDIGLSKDFKPSHIEGRLITDSYLKNMLSKRNVNSEKRDFGSCLIIGGAKGMAGAVIMAGKAAWRSGCGLLMICADEDNRQIIQAALPEAMFISFEELTLETIQKARSIVIGPGLGKSQKAKELLITTLENAPENIVVDADAINIYSSLEEPPKLPRKSIITPHKRELERLIGPTHGYEDLLNKQKAFSKFHGVILVSKGPYTQITDNLGCLLVNTSGNASLAKGGTGDVLAGIIGGLLCFVPKNISAAALGVYIHGKAADEWVKSGSDGSLSPLDLINLIPTLLKT